MKLAFLVTYDLQVDLMLGIIQTKRTIELRFRDTLASIFFARFSTVYHRFA